MVKSYLKFEHSKTFGLISSASSNIIWTPDDGPSSSAVRSTGAGRAIVGANEEVLCWDVKKGELLSRWRDSNCNAEVTAIAQSAADRDIFAVGYEDGSIRIWDARIASIIISFNGHKSAITQLTFDYSGVRLASGSKDTDIILWDLVAEVGLFKLRGHKDQITSVHFLHPSGVQSDLTGVEVNGDGVHPIGEDRVDGQGTFLLTTSKDALIKIWDLSSQHCIETHVAQSSGECWSLGLAPDRSRCVTGGNDGELRAWSIDGQMLGRVATEMADLEGRKVLKDRGTFYRQGKDRTGRVTFHPRSNYIALHGSDKAIEIWRIRSEGEIQKSLARKRKRRREKVADEASKEHHTNGVAAAEDDQIKDVSTALVSEVFVPHVVVRTGGKVRSIDWAGGRSGKAVQLLAATTNNQLETYNVAITEKRVSKSIEQPDHNRTFAVDMPGHRTDIRSLALSSDDRMVSSASNGSLKIWNVQTQSCIRTLECGYSLCSSFLPGDKIVVVGNRDGELELFDIASSTLLDTVKAHDGPIWTLQMHPDGKSVVSGSADKTAKFWAFEIHREEVLGTKRTTPRLHLAHTRTLKLSDDILSLRFSPDSRLLAAALLDNTVKVFFTDTLKLFLNLYGHKLPVLNMDISFDSKLIVTCSADKNVRLWGLDFGDCHKALFAHQDSIMTVAFVPDDRDGNGHHFFSASKDRLIKYWDGDKFEQIQKLEGHHGEVWALAIAHSGEFLVSASHDKSLRIWRQTDEQIFLEEERERELEELYEQTLTASLDADKDDPSDENKPEAVLAAGRQTVETLKAGEKIAEALELGIADLHMMRDHAALQATQPDTHLAPPSRDPTFLALGDVSAERHVLNVVQRIPTAALQDALLVLPFSNIPDLFTFLDIWARREWNIPLTCKVLFFMLKTHRRQIVSSRLMRGMLEGVRENVRQVLRRQKDEMGFNLAALSFIGNQVKERGTTVYLDQEIWEEEDEKAAKGKKRAFVSVA